MKGNKKEIISKITNVVLDILLVVFAFILLISIYKNIQVKVLGKSYADFFGISVFEVQTGSMTGTIGISDWIIVKQSDNIEVNDIITFKKDNDFITHRVVEKYKGTYITKGDANSAKDDPISKEQIVGKVVKIIPKFGIVKRTLFNPIVLLLLIITVYLFNFTFKKKNNDAAIPNNKLDILVDKLLDRIINKIDEENKVKNEKKALKANKIVKVEEVKKEEKEEKVDPLEAMLEDEKEETSEIDKPTIEEIVESKEVIEEPKEEMKVEVESVQINTPMQPISESEAKALHEQLDSMEDGEEVTVEDLGKTMTFRAISVDLDDLSRTFEAISRNEELTANQEKIKEMIKESEPEEDKEPKDDSIIKGKLDMLSKKDKRKFSNVLDRTMYLKSKELEEIIEILNDEKKLLPNEATIEDNFIKIYIDAKYYNHCGNSNADYNNKNMVSKLTKLLLEEAANMTNSYNGNDKGYSNKVNKYANMFITVLQLEQAFNTYDAIDDLRTEYLKVLDKTFRKRSYIPRRQFEIINSIIKVERSYRSMINYILKKVNTEMFEIVYSPLSSNRKLVATSLKHNIEFSKVYSDYIIDKTYTEGIVAEDKVMVMLTLLTSKITSDILDYDFSKKYILYVPGTLYSKDNKVAQLMRVMNNDFLKDNIFILCQYEDLMENKKVIKNLKKVGFRFALSLDEAVKINDKDHPMINIMDYIFINKSKFDTANIIPNLPEEAAVHVISEDIGSKVGNFGGE